LVIIVVITIQIIYGQICHLIGQHQLIIDYRLAGYIITTITSVLKSDRTIMTTKDITVLWKKTSVQ